MGDELYLVWAKKYPHLRFYLATVIGVRGNNGIGGVVRMIEFALVRLLRRAGGPSCRTTCPGSCPRTACSTRL